MNQREAYRMGYQRGWNCASWVDVPEIGSTLPRHVDWVGIGTIEDEAGQRDAMELLAGEAESGDRDFSPFEHTAHAFNEARNGEALWERFDAGIAKGIRDCIAKRFK